MAASLARSKSQDDMQVEDQHIKSILAIEQQRRQARNVKRMNKKLKSLERQRLSLLTMKAFGLGHFSREDIEGDASENRRRFSQTGPLHSLTVHSGGLWLPCSRYSDTCSS
jgi:hypothetical protein